MRHLLQWLEVEAGNRILDVGSGSGWTTALLGQLVGPKGSVTGVEAVPDLVEFGRANLASYPMPWVRIEQARPDALGWPDEAPFDRILVSAESGSVPDELLEQLGPNGIMVLPVASRLVVVRRPDDPDADPAIERHGYYRFVPLVPPVGGQ